MLRKLMYINIYHVYIYIYIYIYIYLYLVFTTEGLFEVAIESWPKWDIFFPYVSTHFD